MIPKTDIHEKFAKLLRFFQTEEFLQMKALGGEIPFFVTSYNPEQELEVNQAIRGLKKQLDTSGTPVLELKLYDICMEILDEELGEGEIFALEQDMDKDEFKNALQSVLDIQTVLIPAIAQKIQSQPAKVYFLTGVGTVFPFIRSHNVLNNLQRVAKDAPTVMFFPGMYNGQSLELFGKLKDDNYYRAFNLDTYTL